MPRRDMRHFRSDPLDEALVARLLQAAHCAPSVGYMQPWRFIRVRAAEVRSQMLALVETERLDTAKALGERQQEFLRLKVEGMGECAEILVAALCDKREQLCSDTARCRTWILPRWPAPEHVARRARGERGHGMVSMFDPETLGELLRMPQGSRPVAILCLGRVDEFHPQPMLETQKWSKHADLSRLVCNDYWSVGGNDDVD